MAGVFEIATALRQTGAVELAYAVDDQAKEAMVPEEPRARRVARSLLTMATLHNASAPDGEIVLEVQTTIGERKYFAQLWSTCGVVIGIPARHQVRKSLKRSLRRTRKRLDPDETSIKHESMVDRRGRLEENE